MNFKNITKQYENDSEKVSYVLNFNFSFTLSPPFVCYFVVPQHFLAVSQWC